MAAPKRNPVKDPMAEALKRRDGLRCFLCGKIHPSLRTMSIGYWDHTIAKTTDKAFLACISCNRTRDQKPLNVYIKEQVRETKDKLAYLRATFNPNSPDFQLDAALMEFLTAPISTKAFEHGSEEDVETNFPARKIQDVPWKELLSRATTWPVFESFIKDPASDHEAELIAAIGRMAKFYSGMQEQTVFRLRRDADDIHLNCEETRQTLMCKWDGQPQYIATPKKS